MSYDGPIANTPQPPYYAVVFTSIRTSGDDDGYAVMAKRMMELAAEQDGFLGVESARDESGLGITVSYWQDPESIKRWHEITEHREAQRMGRERWYQAFALRVARVERAYDFHRED